MLRMANIFETLQPTVSEICWLTHVPLDKMAAILAIDILKCIFLNENVTISIQISVKFVPKASIDNKPALVQLKAWRRIGDKPLSKPILARFTDA